jgi:hypothetical protein
VAEHFKISPLEIHREWSYPMFLNSIERMAVLNEIEMRKAEAMETKP